MKNSTAFAAAAMAMLASLLQAEILVHEPFNYPAGTPLAGHSQGLGFASAWADGPDGGTAFVYDESTATTPVVTDSGNLSWNGVWNGTITKVSALPTPPAARYVGLKTEVDVDKFEAYRPLLHDAGTMAGDDKTLWASVIWHFPSQGYGAHVAFALTTDCFRDRGLHLDLSGNYGSGAGVGIGVASSTFSYKCNAAVLVGGDVVAEAVGTRPPSNKDVLVVVKFVFGTTDTVSVHYFNEDEAITEAIFNTNAVTTSYAIDESKLNLISFDQNRGPNAVDEIRLGDSFQDILTGEGPPAQPLEITEISYDPSGDNVTVSWKSNPSELYGLYWSTDLTNFHLAVNPEIPAHTTNITTTYGPFANPAPNAEKVFFRVGPADTADPVLVGITGLNDSIKVVFSEAMNEGFATDPGNYVINVEGGGTVGIQSISLSADGKTVTITTTTPLDIATAFTVTMNGMTDLAGRALGVDFIANFKTWDDDPNGIKVFILAGQSNMVGYGKVETGNGNVAGAIGSLRYLAVNNDSYPEYNYVSLLADPGQPATSDWKTRSDVKVWWRNGASGDLGGPIQKGDLGPPFQGDITSMIGPEYAFGQVLGDYYDSDDVLIIKTAWGGRSLGGDFRPPSAVAKRGAEVGPFYEAIFSQAREVLNNLGTEFPEWSGRSYQIVGFGWHQGFNDRSSGTLSAEYKDNLPDLISDIRAELGKPELPFVIATTGMDTGGNVESAPYSGYTDVEKAQLWVAGVDQPTKVDTADTRPFWRDKTISPSAAGYHWNESAESYFGIGKIMGDKMVSLLTP